MIESVVTVGVHVRTNAVVHVVVTGLSLLLLVLYTKSNLAEIASATETVTGGIAGAAAHALATGKLLTACLNILFSTRKLFLSL